MSLHGELSKRSVDMPKGVPRPSDGKVRVEVRLSKDLVKVIDHWMIEEELPDRDTAFTVLLVGALKLDGVE